MLDLNSNDMLDNEEVKGKDSLDILAEIETSIDNIENQDDQKQETQDEQDTTTKDITTKETTTDDITTEQLEDIVEETDKSSLNIALHQARTKHQEVKSQIDLRDKEIELLKQQISLIGNQQDIQTKDQTQVNNDVLSELTDEDVITKKDLQVILKYLKPLDINSLKFMLDNIRHMKKNL